MRLVLLMGSAPQKVLSKSSVTGPPVACFPFLITFVVVFRVWSATQVLWYCYDAGLVYSFLLDQI